MEEKNTIRVLYMEDNPGQTRLFQKKMADAGYAVDIAYDGREGLEKYRAGTYDVVVIDYQMPVVDGFEVLQKLAEKPPLPPVIMLTGAGNEEIAVKAMKMGAADYISKDVEGHYFKLLPMVIEDALKRYHYESERRRMQKELTEYALELERSNQELQQFAYVVSHDLKEPLHTIRGFAALLEENLAEGPDGQEREFISYIIDGTLRMERLIEGLLDYSRVKFKGMKLEPVNCNELVAQVVDSLKAAIDKRKARVTWDSLPTIRGNERMLLRVFQNLIDNGLKYCREQAPRVHIGTTETEAAWQFSVRDNGIGIGAKHKERIFLIFQRLHTRGEFNGDGLGLAICKKIIESHRGKIWVNSKPGKGSTFFFTISKAL